MIAQIVTGIIFGLLLLFILGGVMAVHETLEHNYSRITSLQALTLKILVEWIDIPIEELEDIAQCPQCFDEGGICEKHEVEARKALRTLEESK
tara:strand:+ start:121 stop:399 length:279 start_codon:yes stop_codon:yes gene_type:complete